MKSLKFFCLLFTTATLASAGLSTTAFADSLADSPTVQTIIDQKMATAKKPVLNARPTLSERWNGHVSEYDDYLVPLEKYNGESTFSIEIVDYFPMVDNANIVIVLVNRTSHSTYFFSPKRIGQKDSLTLSPDKFKQGDELHLRIFSLYNEAFLTFNYSML